MLGVDDLREVSAQGTEGRTEEEKRRMGSTGVRVRFWDLGGNDGMKIAAFR